MPYSFTTPDLNDFLPGEPYTSSKALLQVENPLALFEGASGAPRLSGDAVATVANDGLPVLSVSAADTYEAAKTSFDYTEGTGTTTSASNVVAATYVIAFYTGSMRFKASQRVTDDGSGATTESTLDIFLNGVLQETWVTSSLTNVERSRDVSIVPGDTVEWRHRRTVGGSASDTSVFSLDVVTADEAYQEVVPLGKASLL